MKPLKSIANYKTALALSSVYFLAMMDRQVLAVLFDPIKEDLGLSDTQLAMVSGIAFALFYSVAGVPLGRLADRVNRVKMLSVCIAVWSVATTLTGFATNFVQLLLARMTVGVGEGGCTPAAHSIISDTYPTEKRSGAIGVYMAGGTLGISTAYLFGGWMVELYGWRIAIICVGLPGLIVAFLLSMFLKEPARPEANAAVAQSSESMGEVLIGILKKPVYLFSVMGHVAATGYLFVVSTWLPAYVNRNFDLSYGEIGTFLFGGTLIGSFCGSVLSGLVTDKLFARSPKWLAVMPAIFLALAGPVAFWGFTSNSLQVLFIAVALLKGLLVGSFVPTFSIVHYVIPANKRGLAVATKLMITSIVAVGIFPIIVGLISDELRASFAEASLRYGLLGFALLCPIALMIFLYLIKLIPAQSIDEQEQSLRL